MKGSTHFLNDALNFKRSCLIVKSEFLLDVDFIKNWNKTFPFKSWFLINT